MRRLNPVLEEHKLNLARTLHKIFLYVYWCIIPVCTDVANTRVRSDEINIEHMCVCALPKLPYTTYTAYGDSIWLKTTGDQLRLRMEGGCLIIITMPWGACSQTRIETVNALSTFCH